MDTKYKLMKLIDCKQGAVRSVRFSTDGMYCITCGSNKTVKLWNPHTSTYLKTYSGHGNEVMDVCSTCDQKQIISCGIDKLVIVWDIATGSHVRRFRTHTGPVTTVAINEESAVVVSGSRDNNAMCWDIRSRSQDPIQVLPEATDAISSVRISGSEILTASFDGKIRKYDIRAGQLSVDCMGEAVTCASFTNDNQCIVASCADGSVKLLDKDSGRLLGEFLGLLASDLCLESNANFNDTCVFSGSATGSIWVWEMLTQNVIAKLTDDSLTKYPTSVLSVHPNKDCVLASNGTHISMWQNVNTED